MDPKLKRTPEDIARAAQVFKALAHPGRLEIACRLAEGPASQKELIAATGRPQSSVARLILPLRELDLVAGTRRGPSGEVALSASGSVIGTLVTTVCDWLHSDSAEARPQEDQA